MGSWTQAKEMLVFRVGPVLLDMMVHIFKDYSKQQF